MTQTLTTERLREIASSPSFSANPLSHEVKYMARELLANREAQPVAYLKKSIIDSERFDSVDPEIILHPNTPEGWHSEYQAVFTAPPAPVVNPEFTGATAVPEKPRLAPHVYRDLLDMLQEAAIAYSGTQQLRAQLSSALSIHVQPDHQHTRAAMLAQPVSHGGNWIACGEQLPAVGETVLVSSDGYVSVGELERSGANYRYFTSVATGRELTVTHWMPLPAAPEGGNEK